MAITHWTLPSPKNANAAQQEYVEQFASILVTNAHLKITVLALSLVCIALAALNIETYRALRDVKPIVIRINEVGRAEALKLDSFDYRPQEAEIRYFLIDFVQRHYSRMRATLREKYARSLYFLDGRLADSVIEANKKGNVMESFLSGSAEEIEVRVNNVSIEDLRNPPYRATVDFEKVYTAAHQQTKRERYVANFVFIVKHKVPNSMIPVNPLGLTITYFRTYDDQVAGNFNQDRLAARLTSLFGALALILASVGLYGVISFFVTRRTTEIGIRMAMGSSRSGIVAMVMRGALRPVLVGIGLGIPVALYVDHLSANMLYGLSSDNPSAYIGATLALAISATAAVYTPVHRAASINPMDALREE